MTKPTARSGASQDTTSLDPSRDTIGTHRDYLAHCLRWSWARRVLIKRLGAGSNRLLDAGCGPKAPLVVELATSPPIVDIASKTYIEYVGVDLNRIKPAVKPKWASYIGEFDLVERYEELGLETFDAASSFEVYEHLSQELQARYLKAIHAVLKPGAFMVFSTPVFNGRAAKNHVREVTVAECQAELEAAGFEVEDRFGTFASWNEIKTVCTPEELETYNRCREFYDDNLLACFMAPKYPDASRNNAWILRRV